MAFFSERWTGLGLESGRVGSGQVRPDQISLSRSVLDNPAKVKRSSYSQVVTRYVKEKLHVDLDFKWIGFTSTESEK